MKSKQGTTTGPVRKKKRAEYRSFKLHKRIKAKTYKPLPNSWQLLKISFATFLQYKKTFTIFLAVCAVLYIIFVRGLSGGVDLNELKTQLQDAGGDSTNALISSTTLFGVLVTSAANTSSEVASVYQVIIVIICTLAFIWILRQISSGAKQNIRVRDSFYNGMTPLVPFLIVMLVIILEFIPMAIGSFLLNEVIANGIAGSGGEVFAISIVAFLLTLLSLYLVSGSICAVYIVTLPGMEPIKALRTSTRLLYLHRWSVLRKLIGLVIILLLLAALIFIPLLLIIPNGFEFIVEALFFLAVIFTLALSNTYFYSLYRSLL